MTLGAEVNNSNPKREIQVEGKGLGTAPPAMIRRNAQLGPISRTMTKPKSRRLREEVGYKAEHRFGGRRPARGVRQNRTTKSEG